MARSKKFMNIIDESSKEKTKEIEKDLVEDNDDDNDDDDDEDSKLDESNEEDETEDEDEEDETEDEDDEFEKQSSSSGDFSDNEHIETEDDEAEITYEAERKANIREWSEGVGIARSKYLEVSKAMGLLDAQKFLHNDDLSSDDEEVADNENTIGRVPLHWYDAFDHIGYNVNGGKLVKRKGMDRIDQILANRDDPNASKTIYDMYNDREVVLSERELEIIRRIQAGAFAHPEFNDTPDYVDYYSSVKEIMPLSAAPEPKRRFVPSKWEMMKVMKIVKAIQEGRYKELSDGKTNKNENPPVYLIWNDEEDDVTAESKKNQFHLPAPKIPLPGHAESYNPPEEYLLTDQEVSQIEEMDPKDRPHNFTPKAHTCLRHVAGYENFLKERFERCLDLYLCPRKLKRRLNIDPETLVPRLPSPSELKPFPNTLCLQYLGHKGAVRSVAISPDGQYLASAGDDGTVRLWEIDSGLCRYVWDLKLLNSKSLFDISSTAITQVLWNPDSNHAFLIAVMGKVVVFITTGTGDSDTTDLTNTYFSSIQELAASTKTIDKSESNEVDELSDDVESVDSNSKKKKNSSNNKNLKCTWSSELFVNNKNRNSLCITKNGSEIGPRVVLILQETITHAAWHFKGDYLALLASNAGAQAVSIHQISKGKTQFPFSKSPGNVQAISFHPTRPYLFVVTQQHVKLFHLIEQKLVKKLLSGSKWLSSIDVHPSGDHVIVGSYDRRVIWFDLDLSSTPYKTLKFHEKAIRSTQFHKRYPLMASASDDGTIHVFHCMVYSDLTRNPMLVPLKVLRGGHGLAVGSPMSVLSIAFHPKQPWLVSAGADGIINLYQDI